MSPTNNSEPMVAAARTNNNSKLAEKDYTGGASYGHNLVHFKRVYKSTNATRRFNEQDESLDY